MPYLNGRFAGLGGTVMGITGSGSANPFNPASYLRGVDTLSVAFHIGLNIGFVNLQQQRGETIIKNQGTTGGLSNIEFYFPIFKWWKMGVFLLPATEISYLSSGFRDTDNIGRTQLEHSGSGGLYRAGWGNAFGWGPISAGFNLNYIVGKVEELDRLALLTDSLAMYSSETRDSRETSYNGFGWDVGIQYVQAINRTDRLTIGASYSGQSHFNARRDRIITTGYTGGVSYTDTVAVENSVIGKATNPGILRTGISYESVGRFLVGADFSCTWWNQYTSELDQIEKTGINQTYRASIGAELLSDLRHNFWMRRLSYRVGANWQTYNYNYAGKQVSGFGVSLGIGIPIRRSRSNIYVFGEYSRMGSLKKGQIESNIGRIGVSFSSVETWFVKMKYD